MRVMRENRESFGRSYTAGDLSWSGNQEGFFEEITFELRPEEGQELVGKQHIGKSALSRGLE